MKIYIIRLKLVNFGTFQPDKVKSSSESQSKKYFNESEKFD